MSWTPVHLHKNVFTPPAAHAQPLERRPPGPWQRNSDRSSPQRSRAASLATDRVQRCTHCRRRDVATTASSSKAASITSLQEAAALDELIDSLMKAPNQPEFEKLVAENVLSFDTKFWIRIATRNDAASTTEEKEKFSTLARSVMVLVEAIVKRTSMKMSDSATVLQDIVKAAADERGEWHLPLTAKQQAAMKQAMEEHSEHLDEGLLSNAFAWMRKASEDRLDGVVGLIQKVLQMYAGLALRVNSPDKTEVALNEMLEADEQMWTQQLSQQQVQGQLDEAAFMAAIRRRMERVVLTLNSGSHAQRIQAEYLKEFETRAQQVLGIQPADASGLQQQTE